MSNTWLSLSDSPPPRATFGRRCWVWFRLEDKAERVGYVDGDGHVRLRGDDSEQLALDIARAVAWRPISSADVEAFEDA